MFFFSSRRRHTRFKCDWSSDVCSSDLFRKHSRARTASSPPSRTSEWCVDWSEFQILHGRLDVCAIAASNQNLRAPRVSSSSVGGRQIIEQNIDSRTTGGMGREPTYVEDP